MSVYMFPGQGSQKIGMGEELFADYPEQVAEADKILGYSIVDLCLKDPQEQLNQTQFTQPALYVVNALSYLKKQPASPNYLVGHSLGEYSALYAAGSFDFATGLKLVQKRGLLMSQATGGGMAAVVGLEEAAVKKILVENDLSSIDIANYNTPSQFVLSGLQSDIARAETIFKENGAPMYVPLKVSGAFHSRHMRAMQNEYAEFLNQFTFQTPKIPVIANVSAQPYKAEINENLINQLANPVKWTDSIHYLMAQGESTFEEIGPGKVLTNMARQISKAFNARA